ncbi:MAG: hypothetical protein JSW09_02750 [Pseudomonadota bacterium]|nr:MAG: hypothetical protein JSW09_02750 [Pseudomonadota bacterium]
MTKSPPSVTQWYRHLDKGQEFHVTAVDEEAATVELQHFDGDLEEVDLDDWYRMDVEPIEAPEDWTGPLDDIERDDLGYTETEMTAEDWNRPLREDVEPSATEALFEDPGSEEPLPPR